MRRSAHQTTRASIWAITILFAILTGGAAWCATIHGVIEPLASHHSHQVPAHSLFCAWACQIGSQNAAGTPSFDDPVPPIWIRWDTLTGLLARFQTGCAASFNSRAPPSRT